MVFDSSTTRVFNRIGSSTPSLVYLFKLIRRLNIIPKFRETLPSLIMGEIHGHDLIDTIETIRKWDVTVTETGSINTTYFSFIFFNGNPNTSDYIVRSNTDMSVGVSISGNHSRRLFCRYCSSDRSWFNYLKAKESIRKFWRQNSHTKSPLVGTILQIDELNSILLYYYATFYKLWLKFRSHSK